MSASFSELVHSLRGAQWRNDPYFWAVVDEFVSPGFAERLAATIPAAGFSASERPSGDPGHRKPYRLESKALNAEDDDKYTPAWRDFLRALRSSEYRTAMSEVIGIDLSGLNLELSLWHYPPGGWLGPHTDKPDKVVTQVFNLNPGWEREWGGCLRILGSDQEKDVVAEIPPVLNSSVILRRSDNSWHMVTRTQESEGAPRLRQVLTAMFRAL
ncbi:2OG-Fe(II) oxygenase [Mesorhizobium huakuii]|uniref:2OG-Fe(II) oxygenase n=1 Tax=Mesorhizobium huakuii TaxID=28104 RepID=A0A7G6T581_9HYPH|nr:2OG-Fe(II) oxygenase [Mesorhizobium huakuii]QND61913.1 2OG-Fe(II) oxygenase [Mesorhizobium huakuii]QND69253.1 2OG-Fe(II) oxygenase [Mesorhizobium loti]